MSGIEPADPSIVDASRAYSRVSEEITTEFMDLNILVAKLNSESYGRNRQQLRVVLTNYIKAKSLPLHLFETKSVLYIQRTDMDPPAKDTIVPVEHTLKTS